MPTIAGVRSGIKQTCVDIFASATGSPAGMLGASGQGGVGVRRNQVGDTSMI